MSALPTRSLHPLPEDKLAQLARLTEELDADALNWASGYLAGVAFALRRSPPALPAPSLPTPTPPADPAAAVDATAAQRVTIVYGSQTGNAKRQAEALAKQVEANGLVVRLLRADAYATRELPSERLLYIVISTQGDGDPPDDARGFVDYVAGRRAPKLPQLKFAVLGLGDSSYPQFCAVAAKLDDRLAELGATRLLGRGEADVDINAVAQPWAKLAADTARDALRPGSPAGAAPLATVTPLRAAAPPSSAPVWNRDNPYAAGVLANQRLSPRNGSKDVRHIELSLEGSGLRYEPGDALGVWPTNPPALVEAILDTLALDGERGITIANETASLRDWLLRKRELTRLNKPFLTEHARRAPHDMLQRALLPEGKDALRTLLADYQLIDVLRQFPARWAAEDLIAALRPLTPRMYSIASSGKAVGDEAHITVAVLDYAAFGERHVGAASHFLAAVPADATVPVFVESNDRFRLPADLARDIIMIGPGTGVAPFRGFLQEREETAASGRNWLFFGNPHFRTDFLYQLEWQQALKKGTLHRLDLAFSRDTEGTGRLQPEKVYVQHALRRRGKEVYEWIANGAHVYVCGDATRMAADVDRTLRDILVEHGALTDDQARETLDRLAQERRYARDVY